MSILEQATKLCPNVDWTGGSVIHVSHARNLGIKYPENKGAQLVAELQRAQYADKLYIYLGQRFGAFEPLLASEEFARRVYIDMMRHVMGNGDTQNETKLKNPVTGNVFHRIALHDDLVGGIRFWCDWNYSRWDVGFRFRIEKLDEAEAGVRERMRMLVEEDKVTIAAMEQEFVINEPVQIEDVDIEQSEVVYVHN